MTVICHSCSYYFAIEISGRRQQIDCPQCGAFAVTPRDESLVVQVACGRCAMGFLIDVTAVRLAKTCPGCRSTLQVRERALLRRLAHAWSLRDHASPPSEDGQRVNLAEMMISPEVVALVPASIAQAYQCMPIRFEAGVLTVAMAGQVREGALEDLALVLKVDVTGAGAPAGDVAELIKRHYSADADGFAQG